VAAKELNGRLTFHGGYPSIIDGVRMLRTEFCGAITKQGGAANLKWTDNPTSLQHSGSLK
jgi:hypothetical protein